MKYTFIYLTIIISNFLFSQTYLATYKITPIVDHIHTTNIPAETYSVLVYSENKSVYSLLDNDSSKSFKTEVPKIEFKDFKQNIKITQTSFFGQGINIREDISKFNWIESTQNKQVRKMKCVLYHTQIIDSWKEVQQVHACVDKSIPVFDGPEDFSGLPGLIIELTLPNKKLELVEIKILKKNTPLKEPTNNFKTLSRSQYEEWIDLNMENMINDMKKREGTIIINP